MLHNDKNKTPDSQDASETRPVTLHTSSETSTPPHTPIFSSSSSPSSPSISPLGPSLLSPLAPDELDVFSLDDLHTPDDSYDPKKWIRYTNPTSEGASYVHTDLLSRGIAAVSDDPNIDLSETKLPFGNREFSIVSLSSAETDRDPNLKTNVASSAQIISRLHLFSQGNYERPDIARTELQTTPLKDNVGIMNLIMDYYSHDLCKNKDLGVIVTKAKKRKSDEIFFPFNFTHKLNSTPTGLYLHFWLPTHITPTEKAQFLEEFNGFTDFFTGSCLFGSALQGFDQNKNRFYLIKPDLKVYPGMVITEIHYEARLQLHETIQMQEFTKLVSLASQLSKEPREEKEKTPLSPHFHFHLPGYDYLLIGAELYLKGNMTKDAFNAFCYIVLNRHTTFAKHLQSIGHAYGIPVTIVNPFQHLFSELDMNFPRSCSSRERQTKQANLGEKVLNVLDIESESLENSTSEERTRKEVLVVQGCMKKLSEGSETIATVWSDFIKYSTKPTITLKDLGHLGNTVMVGAVSYMKKRYSVCTFHPVAEKFIFVQHEKYTEHPQAQIGDPNWKVKYPPLQNCTVMDTAQVHTTHAGQNNGQPFYCLRGLGDLFKVKGFFGNQLRLLEQAGQNVAQCALSPSSHRTPTR